MATTQAILQGKDTTAQGELYSSFELGDKRWNLTMSDGKRNASRYSVDAGDTGAVADCLRRAKARFGLPEQAQVHSCYEAGRDGWWLHRWLIERGIDNIVVASASIEVNRRARRGLGSLGAHDLCLLRQHDAEQGPVNPRPGPTDRAWTCAHHRTRNTLRGLQSEVHYTGDHLELIYFSLCTCRRPAAFGVRVHATSDKPDLANYRSLRCDERTANRRAV
jgi:hypothetical protein